MLAVEEELENSFQEVERLQTQIGVYEDKDELWEARENVRELRKEADESRTEITGLIQDKKMPEHRLGLAKPKVQLHNNRIQALESDNLESSSALEKTRTTMSELEHNLRTSEAKQEYDSYRLRDLTQQIEQFRPCELKEGALKIEMLRLRPPVEHRTKHGACLCQNYSHTIY